MRIRIVILSLFLLTLTPTLVDAGEPVLQPESPATPNCAEKCFSACQMHCRLDCAYNCKCPEDLGAERDACRQDCVTPCAHKCQADECKAETCDQQCAQAG